MSAQYELRDLRFAYSDTPVLKIDAQDFARGRITALIGANGAGKTTLLKILSFLLPPDSGEIRFSTQTVSRKNAAALGKQIGLVPQNPYLLQGSAARNIEIGLKFRGIQPPERDRLVRKMLTLLGIEKLAERSVKSLSGGEAQKIALARILVLDPAVILLDEPFTHLDRESAEELGALIRNLCNEQDKTIIFTGHDRLRTQALSDHIYRLTSAGLFEASASNFFYGKSNGSTFDTGKIKIFIPPENQDCKHLVIDPRQIVISKAPLDSSMRNAFHGKVTAMTHEDRHVNLTVQGAESFHAHITPETLNSMGLKLYDRVFISFKSSAVRLF